MDPFALIFGLALVIVSVFYVGSPLLSKTVRPRLSQGYLGRQAAGSNSPAERRQAVLYALRDLDFDYQTNKVEEDDYHRLRNDLLREAAQLMQKQNQMSDEKLEALIKARRDKQSLPGTSKQPASSPAQKLCPNCQAPLAEDANFCSKCGASAKIETCLKCGRDLQTGDRFCPGCGTTVQRLEQSTGTKGE